MLKNWFYTLRRVNAVNSLNRDLKNKNDELKELTVALTKKNFRISSKYLNLKGFFDDSQEEFIEILNKIESILTSNDYGRTDLKISKVIAEIKYQKEQLEKRKESDDACDIV